MTPSYVDRCTDHLADDETDPRDQHRLGWCRECHREVYLHVKAARLLGPHPQEEPPA